MPLSSVPARGGGMPKLLGQFASLTPITFSFDSPNNVFLAETAEQLISTTDDFLVDGLTIVAANTPFVFWAIGDVWIAGSQAPGVTFKPFIYIPGAVSSAGRLDQGAYGIEAQELPPDSSFAVATGLSTRGYPIRLVGGPKK